MIKKIINIFGIILISPFYVLCLLECKVGDSNRLYDFSCQSLALIPGLPGVVLRRCFYYMVLKSCELNCFIGFGTLLTDRNAIIEGDVYIGNYNVLATVDLKRGTFIASRVSVPSAGEIHERTEDGRWTPFIGKNAQYVSIGPDAWIGEGAIVVADVAQGSMVAAGSVVVKPVESNVLVGGNPAKIIKRYDD